MSKSLTESAAEILAASIGKQQEPMKAGSAAVDDLGGADNQSKPEGDAIGAAVSAKAKVAPKPGQGGAPSEPQADPKKKKAEGNAVASVEAMPGTTLVKNPKMAEETVSEEEEDEIFDSLSEEEIDEFLDSLTEEELEALAAEAETISEEEETLEEKKDEDCECDDDDEDEEEDEEEEDSKKSKKDESVELEMTEEQIAEARKNALKALVSDNMGSCKEDIDALFSGEELSEEFKTKATTIFEAAVRARVEAIVEKVSAENETIMEETISEVEATLTEQVDEYLNYVVEEWVEQNQLAIDSGLRAEIAEDFMVGLKNLFLEHYIEIPEEKADLVDELAKQVADRDNALQEQTEKLAELNKALCESKAQEILRKTCEGLTEVQVAKIKALAEGVEFTTEGEYLAKLAVIRENYFPSGKKVKAEAPQALVETEEPKASGSQMDRYVEAITKIAAK